MPNCIVLTIERNGLTEFNLEPPEPEPTNVEILESWGIKLAWYSEHRVWHIPGMGYITEILELEDEDVEHLTSRDQHAVEKKINEYGEHLMSHYLDDNVWESELGWYARHLDRIKGPTINVKLHETYDTWRLMEKIFDISLEEHEVDPEYVAWNDTIDMEMDWFKSEYIDGQSSRFEHLDGDKFVRGGRSGGWLVYDYGNTALTLGEATELRRVWEEVPDMVTTVAQEVVIRQWAWAFEDLWDGAVDDWYDRERDALIEAVRTNDFQAAKQHEENMKGDVMRHKPDMLDLVWTELDEEVSKQE